MSTATTVSAAGIYYPESDGEPMAETGYHVAAIFALVPLLRVFFRGHRDLYMTSDIFWYFQEGNPDARRAPDVMIFPGVGSHERRSFFSWLEGGAVPAVVFEMSSKSTWREDLGAKYDDFERNGVTEYFLFDPEDLYLKPQLKGFRLVDGSYQPIPTEPDGSLASALGFRVRANGMVLDVIDGRTGELIQPPIEAAEAAEARAEQERVRADNAEQRAAEAIAELERLRQQVRDLSGGQS